MALRKVDICRFENETHKGKYVTSIQNSICIGYKEVRTEKENTSSLNFEHIESGSEGTVHAEI